AYPQPDGSTALRFGMVQYVAFDVGILGRNNAAYGDVLLDKAHNWLRNATPGDKSKLESTMLAGLPGTDEGYTLDQFRSLVRAYDGLSADDLRDNLVEFVSSVKDVAEEFG